MKAKSQRQGELFPVLPPVPAPALAIRERDREPWAPEQPAAPRPPLFGPRWFVGQACWEFCEALAWVLEDEPASAEDVDKWHEVRRRLELSDHNATVALDLIEGGARD